MKKLAVVLALWCTSTFAQAPGALMPVIRQQFESATGVPLSGAKIYSYAAGTSTPLATYTDATLTIQNTNPVIADSGGFATIWLGASLYKICVADQNNVQQYCTDNVSDPGQLLYLSALLLNPTGRANQTVAGPITADQFNGPVSALLPSVVLKTVSNPPTLTIVQPAAPSQVYSVPDPLGPANFVLSPQGSHGVGNFLDCTLTGITCFRTASFYFGGASCGGGTATLGMDVFSTNNPLAFCLSGSNTVKGVMGLPSAYAHLQQNTGTSAAAGTITTTYPNSLQGGNGDMLVLSVAFNATTTITGCTDGTNAYSQAKHIANGALSLDIWVFHNATTKAAGTTLTCTFSAAATGALKWHEYLAPNATSTDVSASGTGTSTTASTGTTAATAQATELVFAAAGDLAAPTLVPAGAGYADHGVLNNSTTVQVDDAGIIQQAIATQSTTFTLGSSQAWAAAVVTFKAANGGPVVAQKTVVLPAFFNSAQSINSVIQWSNPLVAIGTSNVSFSAAISCTGQGTTDDPAFNAASTASSAAGQSAANTTSQVSLTGLNSTGCVAGNILHYQVSRNRYSAADIYEGFANVYGSSLTVGITQ